MNHLFSINAKIPIEYDLNHFIFKRDRPPATILRKVIKKERFLLGKIPRRNQFPIFLIAIGIKDSISFFLCDVDSDKE